MTVFTTFCRALLSGDDTNAGWQVAVVCAHSAPDLWSILDQYCRAWHFRRKWDTFEQDGHRFVRQGPKELWMCEACGATKGTWTKLDHAVPNPELGCRVIWEPRVVGGRDECAEAVVLAIMER